MATNSVFILIPMLGWYLLENGRSDKEITSTDNHNQHQRMAEPINANPTVLDETSLPTRAVDKKERALSSNLQELLSLAIDESDTESVSTTLPDEEYEDAIDPQEVFDLIAHISDPEHPLTLGQLAVVNLSDIKVIDSGNKDEMAEVVIKITPTITHCSLATLIGLGIRVRLERCLPVRFRITILLKEGSHQSENQVNKQLNDKERVAAACENDQLLNVISKMLATCK
jgi:metal-sulfur cluster biosynthetic enzyme